MKQEIIFDDKELAKMVYEYTKDKVPYGKYNLQWRFSPFDEPIRMSLALIKEDIEE